MEALKAVFDATSLGIVVYKAVRDSAGKIINYEILTSNTVAESWHNKNDHKLLESFNKVMLTGKSLKKKLFHEDHGVNNWSSITAVKLNDNELLATIEDITALKQAEAEIKKQSEILNQTEELAKAGYWDFDVSTKDFLWTDGMYQLFEIKKGTPVRPSVYLDTVIKEDREKAERIVRSIEKNFQPVEETIRIKPNGIVKTIRVKAGPLKNDFGQIEKMLGVDMDITEAELAEERIMELNRTLLFMNRKLGILNTELKTFNQVAASDYDQTLKHLYTNLEFIITKDAANLSNQSKANIRRAQTAIQKLKLLTEDIIAYTELDHDGAQKETVSLNVIVKSVLHDMKDKLLECNAVVEYDDLPSIQGYPSLLLLLFNNLVDNAIKFCGEARPPVLKIGYKGLISGAETGNSEIEKKLSFHFLSIKDNGIGIGKEETEKIFEIFYRQPDNGKYKGSGIGLAICRKIMAMHEGYIMAEPGKEGAVFNCFFPANGKY
jgi:signal transduction histidine kinase